MAEALPDEIQGELTCSICYDLYDQPLSLPCAHTYCRKCLQGLLASRLSVLPGMPQSLTCPRCRQVVTLRNGLDDLPRNTALANIVGHVTRRRSGPEGPQSPGSSALVLRSKMREEMQLRLQSALELVEQRRGNIGGLHSQLMEKIRQVLMEGDFKKEEVGSLFSRLEEQLQKRKVSLLSKVEEVQGGSLACLHSQLELLESRMDTLSVSGEALRKLMERIVVDEEEAAQILSGVEYACGSNLSDTRVDLTVELAGTLELPRVDFDRFLATIDFLPIGISQSGGSPTPPEDSRRVPQALSSESPSPTSCSTNDLDPKPPASLLHTAPPRITKSQLKHIDRFLAIEVAWTPVVGADHYQVTTRGPGLRRCGTLGEEEVCVRGVVGTELTLHHLLFVRDYTLTVAAVGRDGQLLACSEAVLITTPRRVHFEDVKFYPSEKHYDIAIYSEMRGIFHKECPKNAEKKEWPGSPLKRLPGATTCSTFSQPQEDGSTSLAYWLCNVVVKTLGTLDRNDVICDVGICKYGCLDRSDTLCTNPRSFCVLIMKRSGALVADFWDGWRERYAEADDAQSLCAVRPNRKTVIALGFLMDMDQKRFIIVDPERDAVLQDFALPKGRHEWVPAAALYNEKRAKATVKWAWPDSLPDCLMSRLAKR